MGYYKFQDNDIINTQILCHPSFTTELNGNIVTGSVRLERPFLNTNLANRIFHGFSQKEGGFIEKTGSLSSSIDFRTAVSGGTNSTSWHVLNRLYNFYSLDDSGYKLEYTGTKATIIRVISIPQVYYNKEILTGSLTASDNDGAGAERRLYDNGRGGIYSGSLTGTLVGNIFYSEGIIALTKPDLTSSFGADSSTNFLWRVQLKGTHSIPVKIFKCRAPAGQLNVSNNESFYVDAVSGSYTGMREIVSASLDPRITHIGLYNDAFELVAVASVAQAIKKSIDNTILFKLSMDW